jgi:hypothetical protein
LRRVRAMHEHVAVARGSLRLRHRADDAVAHVRDERIARDRRARRPVARHEDRDSVVMVAAPVVDLLHGAAAREDRAGRPALGEKVGPGPSGSTGCTSGPGSPSRGKPYHSCSRMKSSPPGLPGPSFGAAMYPSSDIDM